MLDGALKQLAGAASGACLIAMHTKVMDMVGRVGNTKENPGTRVPEPSPARILQRYRVNSVRGRPTVRSLIGSLGLRWSEMGSPPTS